MTENPQQNQQNANPSFMLKGQYIKDLSFESPMAPASLVQVQPNTNIELDFDLVASNMQNAMFEVVMKINARAISDSNTIFVVELIYAGVYELHNIPQEHIQRVLMVDGAFLLYPFARRVIADVTRDGGFPPLLLEPVDFETMFAQKTQSGEQNQPQNPPQGQSNPQQ